MVDTPKIFDDENDLISLIKTIWNGKLKIASMMALFPLLMLCYNIIYPNKTFTALTEIKPLSSIESDKYLIFNETLKLII